MNQPLSLKLASLSLISQAKLKAILAQCGEKKDLIIDPTLIKPLERVCDFTWLKNNGIEKVFKMEPQLGTRPNINRVYFIPACAVKYRCVLDQISALLSQNPSLGDVNCFHIIVLPKVITAFESMLESRGLYDIVKLYPFTWELMMLDEQLLSLELPFLYKQVYVDHNSSILSSISMSLFSLFHVIGRPKVMFSVGKQSASVLDILEIYNESYSRNFADVESSREIGALVVLDRDQDYASSLLTPATYSGLLHEMFNINCGYLDLDVHETKYKKGQVDFGIAEEKPPTKTKNTVITLDSSVDTLYAEIKHRHFSEVLSVLSSKAKLLKNEDIKALGIQEIKQFVSTKLQQIALLKQSLVNHVVACEAIVSEMSNKFEDLKCTETEMLNNRNKKANFTFIDENFGTDIHVHNSLRLMCLLSITQGLTYDEYNSLVNKYLMAFGHKFLYVFSSLERAGLLTQPAMPKLSLNISNLGSLGSLSDHLPKWQNTFQSAASKLRQLSAQAARDASCPSYVFNGGYVPLAAALCQALLAADATGDLLARLSKVNNLKVGGKFNESFKDGMAMLNEKLGEVKLNSELEFGCKDLKNIKSLKEPSLEALFPLKPKSVLVYVVGGVTYAEVAACHLVQALTGGKVYVASDCVSSGGDVIAACI